MAKFLFTNNAVADIAEALGTGGTSLVLASGHGGRFPNPGEGEQFAITLKNGAGNLEIVYCTARSGDTLTIVRAQEGTAALEYVADNKASLRLTKGVVDELSQKAATETISGAKTFTQPVAVPAPTAGGHAANREYAETVGFTTGDVKLSLKTAAATGWVVMNDGTIGNASSGATARAHADTEALFILLWTNTIDTWCPVSGGRGGSAAADFAANKTIALPKVLGRALAGAGTGSGLTTRALAETLGTQTHTLSTTEMPSHNHGGVTNTTGAHTHTLALSTEPGSYAMATGTSGLSNSFSATTGSSGNHYHTVSAQGGGGAHNNMQPTLFLNVHIKL